jgi:hypothetical protein
MKSLVVGQMVKLQFSKKTRRIILLVFFAFNFSDLCWKNAVEEVGSKSRRLKRKHSLKKGYQ